jgi:hypothetical protein
MSAANAAVQETWTRRFSTIQLRPYNTTIAVIATAWAASE